MTDEKRIENVDGNEYTFVEWLVAAGQTLDGDSDPTMLVTAWSAGEDPELYRAS
jgi:hypothetical protein